MYTNLHIALTETDQATRDLLTQKLGQLGHKVSLAADDGELVQLCRSTGIKLAFIGISASHLEGLRTVERIYQHRPLPVIVVSDNLDPEEIDSPDSNHVFAYLIKPIKESDVVPAIQVAHARFAEIQKLQGELQSVQRALDDRKIIERAKGILMQQSGIDEETAFKNLQRLARSKSRRLAEVAEMIVTAKEVLDLSNPDPKS